MQHVSNAVNVKSFWTKAVRVLSEKEEFSARMTTSGIKYCNKIGIHTKVFKCDFCNNIAKLTC